MNSLLKNKGVINLLLVLAAVLFVIPAVTKSLDKAKEKKEEEETEDQVKDALKEKAKQAYKNSRYTPGEFEVMSSKLTKAFNYNGTDAGSIESVFKPLNIDEVKCLVSVYGTRKIKGTFYDSEPLTLAESLEEEGDYSSDTANKMSQAGYPLS